MIVNNIMSITMWSKNRSCCPTSSAAELRARTLKAWFAVHLALCTSNSTISMRIRLETFPSFIGHNQGTSNERLTALGWTQVNSEDTDMNEIWSLLSRNSHPGGAQTSHIMRRALRSLFIYLFRSSAQKKSYLVFGDSRPFLQISTATMRHKLFTYITANWMLLDHLLVKCALGSFSPPRPTPHTPAPVLSYHLANTGKLGSISFFSPNSPFHLLLPLQITKSSPLPTCSCVTIASKSEEKAWRGDLAFLSYWSENGWDTDNGLYFCFLQRLFCPCFSFRSLI